MSLPPGTQATPTQSSLDNGFQPLSPSLDVSSSKEPYLVQRLEAMSLHVLSLPCGQDCPQ